MFPQAEISALAVCGNASSAKRGKEETVLRTQILVLFMVERSAIAEPRPYASDEPKLLSEPRTLAHRMPMTRNASRGRRFANRCGKRARASIPLGERFRYGSPSRFYRRTLGGIE
jgi:hypothetical protein